MMRKTEKELEKKRKKKGGSKWREFERVGEKKKLSF
jgi:hypothetical protein